MTSLPPLPDLPTTRSAAAETASAAAGAAGCRRKTHGFTSAAHWVIPGMLMQGRRPVVAGDDDDVRDIVVVAKCGTFVCLQAECVPEEGSSLLANGGVRDWECDHPMDLPQYCDEVRASAAAAAREEEIGGGPDTSPPPPPPPSFLHYGIRDMNAAESIDGLADAVSDLANRILSGDTIYLHCWGGKGRAGLVAACLLIRLYRIDANSALEYVRTLCHLRNVGGDDHVHYDSPETEEQMAQVREYYERVTINGK